MQFWLGVSGLAGAIGLVLLSNATMGVGIIGFALLCAVWARIAQAGAHAQQRAITEGPAATKEVV